MRKLLLPLLLLLAFAPPAAADSGGWSPIGAPFCINDIYGRRIDLKAILDSGYAVVIDYSCCWCAPCWGLHTSGILDSLHRRLGPAGANRLRVMWAEVDPSNSTDQIHGIEGGSGTRGDWTNGNTVPYPIIDDNGARSCLATCLSLYQGYVPSCFFIAPSGAFREIELRSDNVAGSIALVEGLMDTLSHPRLILNEAPATAVTSTSMRFSAFLAADCSGWDSLRWTFEGGIPASAHSSAAVRADGVGSGAFCQWDAPGTYTYSVTASRGANQITETRTIQVFDWTPGDTRLSYCGQEPYALSLGSGSSASSFNWGVMFTRNELADSRRIHSVELFVRPEEAGDYTLSIYSGGHYSPATPLLSRTYSLSPAEASFQQLLFPVTDINPLFNLWITFAKTGGYPAAACAYTGDENSDWIGGASSWSHARDNGHSCSWLIRCTTSSTAALRTLAHQAPLIGPNPTTGKVEVRSPSDEPVLLLEVFDLRGRRRLSAPGPAADLSDCPPGIYFLIATTPGGTTTHKIVKQ